MSTVLVPGGEQELAEARWARTRQSGQPEFAVAVADMCNLSEKHGHAAVDGASQLAARPSSDR